MRITRHQVVQLLANRGDIAESEQAETELPEVLDTVEHEPLLTALGVEAARLDGRIEDETGSS